MTAKIGDIGTEIIVEFKTKDCNGQEVVLDISAQTTLEICLKKPDTTTVTTTGVFTAAPCGLGDGTDGKASYFTIAGDLDQAGTWCVEGHVILPTGEWKADVFTFEVAAPIC